MIPVTSPINLAQLRSALGPDGIVRIEHLADGSLGVSSAQYTDAELSAALASVTYDPTYGSPAPAATLAGLQSAAEAGTLTSAEVQQAIAALIALALARVPHPPVISPEAVSTTVATTTGTVTPTTATS